MLKAAVEARNEEICKPILLGNEDHIRKQADELKLNLEGIEIINLRDEAEAERRARYAKILAQKKRA